ncbi:type III pantothenate kinase [Actinopolymorpha sp. NPDC004070]|uniref:type III pantothenate kinase n=1 Tax=Actinopolymorpha sp. NPDC004070 TaxID=3154548 RepID=UPI00339E1258
MLLAVDVGNTHTVLGLFDRTRLVEHWRVSTEDRRTADELAVLVAGLLAGHTGAEGVTGVAICSTVPTVLHELREMVARYYGEVPSVIVEPGVRTGVPVLMDNPREVGADRIVNALAVYEQYGTAAIVVDFGTATTFDVVSERGEYIGGAISPGIEISLEALGRRGAQLRRVELLRPRTVIAKNTVEALQSGAVYGFAGQVDGLVTRMIDELGLDPAAVTVVATGGLAPVVVEECRKVNAHEPWLTLHGLRLVFARNQPAS